MRLTRVSWLRSRARCAIHAAMLSDAPVAVSLLFVVTVVGMLLLVLWGAMRAARRVGPGAVRGVRLAGVALGGWLALTAALAERGFFEDFYALPPHMLLAVGPPLLAVLALAASGRLDPLLAALTAPIVAYACFVRRAWPARVARWWNWAGVVILLNVVVHAQLSAPTRFRLFETDPPTTFIGDLPYIWLPAFLVPLAWALHAISLRQLRSTR